MLLQREGESKERSSSASIRTSKRSSRELNSLGDESHDGEEEMGGDER